MGYCLYSSKEEHYIFVKSRICITGCFSLRTSMTSRTVLVFVSPGNNTPIFPCPLIPLTTAQILQLTTFELKVLTSVSSLSLVVLAICDCLSATVSAQRAACCPIFHRFRFHVILRQISWALSAHGLVFRITPMNTMGRSAFHPLSISQRNSSVRHLTNLWPTALRGLWYLEPGWITSSHHRTCQTSLSTMPPFVWVLPLKLM